MMKKLWHQHGCLPLVSHFCSWESWLTLLESGLSLWLTNGLWAAGRLAVKTKLQNNLVYAAFLPPTFSSHRALKPPLPTTVGTPFPITLITLLPCIFTTIFDVLHIYTSLAAAMMVGRHMNTTSPPQPVGFASWVEMTKNFASTVMPDGHPASGPEKVKPLRVHGDRYPNGCASWLSMLLTSISAGLDRHLSCSA
ncbi:hypothetical protein IMY05_C4626000100 [Salix suchowensis]|nr:hypothetical protein IMY05_C4626000100 [Salix suchowensis]